MKKRVLSLLLTLAMLLSLVPAFGISAAADPAPEVATADQTATVGSYTIVVPKGAEIPNTTGSTTVTPVTNETNKLDEGWWVVNNNVTTSDLEIDGDVKLILADGWTLTANGTNKHAGITVSDGNKLTIFCQTGGTGKVNATGGDYGAGIGGGEKGEGSNITINGGVVTATGGSGDYYGAAGIGGGNEGAGSNITINGGTVTATGKKGGAGIGGGYCGAGSDITINGGTVTATGGNDGGAGIGGGGGEGDGSNITINGGNVTANGGNYAAGIGGGDEGEGSNITISDGTVTATGGQHYGAGIGGGDYGKGSYIEISGGTVVATGGKEGSGIGGGTSAEGSNITISGGTVTAKGKNRAAGIGGGGREDDDEGGEAENITISGGIVTAEGDKYGVGIGGGDGEDSRNITISKEMIVIAGESATQTSEIANSGTDLASALNNKVYAKAFMTAASITIGDPAVTTYYDTVQKAIDTIAEVKTVRLRSDVAENVSISKTKNITLDLNGHVLKGTGSGSVITNKGTLTIKDSGSTNEHKYVVGSDGLWTWNDSAEGAATNFENLTARPATNDVIIVKGGAITGRGIVNKKTLTIDGGNIVGNSNDWNGGILNDGGTLYVTNGKILGNKSLKTSGGGIINKQGTATIGTNTDIGSVLIECNTGSNGAGGVLNYANEKEASLTINKTCKISYNFSEINGGGVENYAASADIAATITMNGGEISNNNAKSNGGGICNGKNCTLTLAGGTIKNNKADKCGGGIYNRLGTINMTGAEITNNTAGEKTGGVYNENGTFTMTGGEIKGNNAATNIGGVLNEGDATFTVGGTAKIYGNTYGSTTASNLVILYGKTISIATGTDVPADGMSVGVTMLNEGMDATITGKFTSAATADYSSKFFADDSTKYEVRHYKNGENYLARVASNAPACEITSDGNFRGNEYDTIAEALTDAGITATTIKLLRDVTEKVTIAAGQNIVLELNGKVLKATEAGSVITNNGTLTIADSNPNAIHKFSTASDLWALDETNGNYTVNGGVITGGTGTTFGDNNCGGAIYNNGTLTIEKGNIVGNTAKCGGGVALLEHSSFTMNGGTIEGNTSSEGGAGIFIWPDSSFTMKEGAAIKDNTASDAAGGVYVAGKFTMNGGEISNNNAGSFGGGVYVYKKDSSATKDSTTTIDFEMKGGKITKNSAKRRGGGVCVDYYDLGMKMTGGEISSNKVTANPTKDANDAGGGGIWVGKSLTLGGNAVVKNNTLVDKDSKTVTNNVHMPIGKYSGNTIKPIITLGENAEALNNNAAIGISSDSAPTSGNPVAFTKNANADFHSYFSSDDASYMVYNDTAASNTLKLGVAPTFDDRFSGTITKDNYSTVYTENAVPTITCHAKDKGYTFGGWFTGIDGTGSKLTGIPASGTVYYAKWTKNGKTVVTQTLNLDWQTPLSDSGITWDKTTCTLTLDGATVDVYGDSVRAILLPETNSKLVLAEGSINSVTLHCTKADANDAYAINALSGLKISGTGTLNVTATAVSASCSAIISKGSQTYTDATVNATADSYPICAQNTGESITIKSGNVTANAATGVSTDSSQYAICAFDGDVNIEGGTVTTTGGSHGIVARVTGKLSITGGTVHASAATTALWAMNNITVSGGTVTAETTGTPGNDYGINSQAGNITISGGTVTATGNEIGIRSKAGDVTVSGEAVVTSKGDTSAVFVGPSKNLIAKGSKITANAAKDNTGALVTPSVELKNGIVSGFDTAKYMNIVFRQAKIGNTEYATLQKAVNAANNGDTITLLGDIAENVNIDKAVTIALNGHQLTGSQSTTDADTPIKLLIASEIDMKNAMNVAPAWLRQTWEIANDITLTQFVRLTNRRLIINGNNNTIIGASGTGEENKTLQMFAIDSVNSDFKNVVKINNLKIVGSERFKNVIAVQNKDDQGNKGINLTLKNVSIDQKACRDNGAAIVNFGSDITVYGTFKVETCSDSCYAIGMLLTDAQNGTADLNASLDLANATGVTFTDNRSSTQKSSNPFIRIAAKGATGTATITGAYVTNKLVEVKSGETLLGYNLKSTSSPSNAETTYAVSSADAAHGSVSVDKKNAAAGSTVTLTVKADKGWTLETLTVKDAKGNEVELTVVKVGETYTFKMPEGDVTVTATFMEDNTMLNFFVDVKADDYFYDAVLWAATNGITSGVDATHFAPNNITTRGQMVTFLWRAAGCPEPTTTTCAFTDTKADEFYYKAVLWAVEKGLTKGVSTTEFAPDVTVDRAQSVTFLARYEGIKDDATGYSHGFADVAASDYYNNAVAWAAANKVTDGTSETTFAPNDSCLRAQIVTFIYRNFAK